MRSVIPLVLTGSFLVAVSSAQLTGGLPNLSSAIASESAARESRSEAAATNSAGPTTTGGNAVSRTASATVVITGGVADTASAAVPTITGPSNGDNDAGLPSGLPTLSGAFKIIPASVPPNAGAPYMQTSSLPEGTVFIAVGAILGFFAMSVILWRALVAWSLHRSVKRASQNTSMADRKSLFGQHSAPVYSKYKDRDSMHELSNSGGKRKSHAPSMAPGAASASSLFFSPTAGAVSQAPGNRGSNYLPAGYYAAGASAPGNNQSHVSLGQGPAISLSNLGPHNQRYSRATSMGPSPPESPGAYTDEARMQSSSTLHLTRSYGAGDRPPSSYLEEMFDAPHESQSRRASRHDRT